MAKTIFVIDDEKGVLEELEAWLGDQGYNVITAENALDALAKLEDIKPNLIILDIIMPKMDGLEFLSILKRNIKHSSIPVIMLTAKVESENILKAQELHAKDYIMKPFETDELLQLIQRYES